MEAESKIYENVVWPYRLVGNLLLICAIWVVTVCVITVRHNLVGKQIDSLLCFCKEHNFGGAAKNIGS